MKEENSRPSVKLRSRRQRMLDGVFFPLRALTLFHEDRWGLSCLATERFDYVAKEVRGWCLDIGCGYHNKFIALFLNGQGIGVDVYQYEGLTKDQILSDMTNLPFDNHTFGTVTFIANINHCPQNQRDLEISEAYRVLKPGGRIILTMGNPIAEILVHWLVWMYDRILGTHLDMDTERGMEKGEEYYLTDDEIRTRLTRAGFINIQKKHFGTQWCLNHLFIAEK